VRQEHPDRWLANLTQLALNCHAAHFPPRDSVLTSEPFGLHASVISSDRDAVEYQIVENTDAVSADKVSGQKDQDFIAVGNAHYAWHCTAFRHSAHTRLSSWFA